MKRFSYKATILLALSFSLIALMPCAGLAQGGSQEKPAVVQLLFVQNGVSGSFDGKTLTLQGIGPTIFFSDRPQRVAGHVRTAEFIGHWDKGSDNFAENPPNATLSIFGPKEIQSAVVELRGPSLKRNTLSYKVKILQGKVPASFKESSLFIDILGRWRMAAMGMAVGEARGMAMGAAMARPAYYHPAPAPMPVYGPPPSAPIYTAPAPPSAVNVTVTSPSAVTSGQADAVQKLKQLKSLLSQGLITQSQYQEESQKILNQLVQ